MRTKHSHPIRIVLWLAPTAVSGLVLFMAPGSAAAASGSNDTGAVALLVKSKSPLTTDVAAAIGAHAVHVSYVWPEIDAMAVTVNPAKIAELTSDPLVAMVEADQQPSPPSTGRRNSAARPTSQRAARLPPAFRGPR
jgi:hypothetical protein